MNAAALAGIVEELLTGHRWRDPELEALAAIAHELGAVASGFPKSSGSTFLMSTAMQSAIVATSELCNSAAYGNLATVGPAPTITIGPSGVLVVIPGFQWISQSGSGYDAFMSYALSGSNTVAAADANSAGVFVTSSPNQEFNICNAVVHTGMAAGATTATAKYRATTGSGNFAQRCITLLTY